MRLAPAAAGAAKGLLGNVVLGVRAPLSLPGVAKPLSYPEPGLTRALDVRAFLFSYLLSLLKGEGRRK